MGQSFSDSSWEGSAPIDKPRAVWTVAWSGKGGSWQSNGWDSSLSLGSIPATKTPHVWGEGKKKKKKGRGYPEFQQNLCGEGSSQEAISDTEGEEISRPFGHLSTLLSAGLGGTEGETSNCGAVTG